MGLSDRDCGRNFLSEWKTFICFEFDIPARSKDGLRAIATGDREVVVIYDRDSFRRINFCTDDDIYSFSEGFLGNIN